MIGNRIALATLCIAAAGIFATSARAQDDEVKHFKIYGGPAYVAPMEDSDVTIGTVTDSIEAEKQVGWNIGFEGRFNKWFGLELDYVDAQTDVSFGGTTIGETNFSPLTATFNIHLVHAKVVDFYLGPSYSWVNWGDISLNTEGSTINGGSEIGTDSSSNWGVSLGIDFNIGEHFAIGAGLKYLNVDLETSSGQTYGVKPLVARLTAAFRF